MRSDHRLRRLALASAAAFALAGIAGCTSDDAETVDTTIPPTTTVPPPADDSDGRLRFGFLSPSADPLLTTPLTDAVEVAIDQINAAGGVLDQPVRYRIVDEGDTTATAIAGIRSLLDDGVDAIVGPASSIAALNALGEIVEADTLACSPTASAIALDTFPDDGLFFRTVPSDSLQARAIAQVADQTGATRAAIIHFDDAYGRGLASGVADALQGTAITNPETIPVARGDDDLADDVQRLISSDATVAIVLADADDGSRILTELDALDTSSLDTVIVNDAVHTSAASQAIADLGSDFREKIVGTAPQAQAEGGTPPFDPPGAFATNAFDCVNLIALAAVRAQSDEPREIAAHMQEVSASGSPCTSFAACADALSGGLSIDYDGPSGVTELQSRGDPQRAEFTLFTFDANGQSVFNRTLNVSY